jgi:hypothetical protein
MPKTVIELYEALKEADEASDAKALSGLAWELFGDLGQTEAELAEVRALFRTSQLAGS